MSKRATAWGARRSCTTRSTWAALFPTPSWRCVTRRRWRRALRSTRWTLPAIRTFNSASTGWRTTVTPTLNRSPAAANASTMPLPWGAIPSGWAGRARRRATGQPARWARALASPISGSSSPQRAQVRRRCSALATAAARWQRARCAPPSGRRPASTRSSPCRSLHRARPTACSSSPSRSGARQRWIGTQRRSTHRRSRQCRRYSSRRRAAITAAAASRRAC